MYDTVRVTAPLVVCVVEADDLPYLLYPHGEISTPIKKRKCILFRTADIMDATSDITICSLLRGRKNEPLRSVTTKR